VSYLTTVLADAPVHYWRCNDPGGGLLNDIGSAPKFLTLVTVNSNALPYGGVNTDGASGWFDANTGAWHNPGDALVSPRSLECWVWRHALSGRVEVFCSHYVNLQITAANTVLWASGGPNVTSPATITEQAWHHIVGTYGPVGGAKLYIDGVNVVTGAYTGAFAPGAQVESIGMSGAGGNFTSANVCEVADYATELSAARVSAHFAAADLTAGLPLYLGFGAPAGGAGLIQYAGPDLALILKSVYRSFPNT